MKNLFLSCLLCLSISQACAQRLSLAGQWTVSLGSQTVARSTVSLPGSLDDAGLGDEVVVKPELNIRAMAHLARKKSFIGKAYYSRQFKVSPGWKGKQVDLVLERVMWRSSVYIDGVLLPVKGESLSTLHRFDITDYIRHGQTQVVTISVDNTNAFPGINIEAEQYPDERSREMAHGYTNHTQIKWNGILGNISLEATPVVHPEDVSVFPDPVNRSLAFELQVKRPEGRSFRMQARVWDPRSGVYWPISYTLENFRGDTIRGRLAIPSDAEFWDEFNPKLYSLEVSLKSGTIQHVSQTPFGIRQLARKDGELQLNGVRIFLRGNLECSIFPLTGYPPTDKGSWMQLLRQAKSFGLNHVRFHSWCPPNAAFEAADELGCYLQVELPHWNLKAGSDSLSWQFLSAEATRILKSYGNHPSFMFFSLGNELEGDFSKLGRLTETLRKADDRRLYATTTFTFQKGITGNPQPEDDFYVTQWTNDGWIRGQGIFNDKSPDFSTDYTSALKNIKLPVISHEIGQYCVFPDLDEIEAYTGNLVPRNLEAVRDDMARKGLLPLAREYVKASAHFASLLYKEEIERALKTKDFDGFQLLQLQDFPGQGTALVGLLNAFWKPKPGIRDSIFRRSCAELVMLARFPKAIYLNDEVFKAGIEVANFYRPLTGAQVSWTLRTEDGKHIQSGQFAAATLPVGNALNVGSVNCNLSAVHEASKLIFTVSLDGLPYENSWDIWVYPARVPEYTGDVLFTRSWSAAMLGLNAGKKVLFNPELDSLKGITGKFVPVFWSPVHFPDQPGTMGLLIKDRHPSLSLFPTDRQSNWQWWDLTIKSKTLDAAGIPDEAIVVRVMDNFMRNGNLSNLMEFKVGHGSLILCSIDIDKDLDKRPQARQLRHSLLNYMNSPLFNPTYTTEAERLQQFMR